MATMMTNQNLELVPHQHRCDCGREFQCTTPACVDKIIPCTVCKIDGARGAPRRRMPTPVPKVIPGMAIGGKLPGTYEAARLALAECSRIDECRDWANKAEALASYAKQAGDGSLRKMADRIQARAIRRCGELLHQIEPAPGVRTDLRQPGAGADPKLTRTAAARDAGLSVRQQKTAVRIARIPEPDFNAAVESADPPTVTELAERGRASRPPDVKDTTITVPVRIVAPIRTVAAMMELLRGILDRQLRDRHAFIQWAVRELPSQDVAQFTSEVEELMKAGVSP